MIHDCSLAQGVEKYGQIVSSISTRLRNLVIMVAEQHGYDTMATAARRRDFEEEHVNVESVTAGRRRRSEEEHSNETKNSCADLEEFIGGSVGVRQQVLVNGPVGTSHWKRCRVHQEADIAVTVQMELKMDLTVA